MGEKIRNLVSNISYFSIEFGRKSDDHVIMHILCELGIGPDHLQLTLLNWDNKSVLALNKRLKVNWKFQFFI